MTRPKSQAARKPQPVLQPRFRARIGSEIAIGPGKAELLELIRDTRSIQEAARRMNMSYMRAWKLLRTMNDCFQEPLVAAERGGKGGGGARLTPTGREVLTFYRAMEEQSLRIVRLTLTVLFAVFEPVFARLSLLAGTYAVLASANRIQCRKYTK